MADCVMYLERLYPDTSVERAILDPDIELLVRDVDTLDELDPSECGRVDGLMVFRHHITADDLDRFPKLRVLVRMGVGFDRVDLVAAAERGIVVSNVPDYGTTEIADHTMAMVLALRRGILLHHEAQRRDPPAPWTYIETPLVERSSSQTFGIVGLGRIGTAVALRAKAFGFRVVFYDPYLANGVDLALGVERARTLPELLSVSDVLSLNCLLYDETRGMIGAAELAQLPRNAVVVNTARGGLLDIDALHAKLRDGHLAGAGLDVLAVDPPGDTVPELLRAYRQREPWLEGRVVFSPHVAYYSEKAQHDTRVKSVETMQAALSGRPQNVVVGPGAVTMGLDSRLR
ncbi:phosphoglycerate dehydrogenase-like enzyme [Amorphus suaedae]